MTTHDDPNDPMTRHETTSPGRVEVEERSFSMGEYVRLRYGVPHPLRGHLARLSHVQWIAEKVRAIASDLLTEAQLREEEAIENLVRAKNACDETVAPAQAVLAAAESVEELERNIEWLTKLIDDPHPGAQVWTAAPADDEDETPPAGDCDA